MNQLRLRYANRWYLTHPWEIAQDIIDNTRWAWQRVVRGWDDRVIWSIDIYLAEMMPIWLRKLQEDKSGAPLHCFDDDDWDENHELKDGAMARGQMVWEMRLGRMIAGFQAARMIQDAEAYAILDGKSKEREDRYYEIYNKGMDELKESFFALWD